MNSQFAVHGETNSERRAESRQHSPGRLSARIVQSDDPALDGVTFEADLLEISPSGLRLTADAMLPPCQLHLWVRLNAFPERLFLTAELVWSSIEASGEHQLGVELMDNPLTDVEEWRTLHSHVLRH